MGEFAKRANELLEAEPDWKATLKGQQQRLGKYIPSREEEAEVKAQSNIDKLKQQLYALGYSMRAEKRKKEDPLLDDLTGGMPGREVVVNLPAVKYGWYDPCLRSKQAADQIPGGLADGKPDSDFNKKQLDMGSKVEMEHVDDKAKAREISRDHLEEIPDYYTRLDELETEAKADAKGDRKKNLSAADKKDLIEHISKTKDLDDEKMHGFYASKKLDPHAAETAVYEALRTEKKGGVLGEALAPLGMMSDSALAGIAQLASDKMRESRRPTSDPGTLVSYYPRMAVAAPSSFHEGYTQAESDADVLQAEQIDKELAKARKEYDQALSDEYAGRHTAKTAGELIDGLAQHHVKCGEGELNQVMGTYLALASLLGYGSHVASREWVRSRDPRQQEFKAVKEELRKKRMRQPSPILVEIPESASSDLEAKM